MLDVRPFDAQRATEAEIDEYSELRGAAFRVDLPEMTPPTRAEAAVGPRTRDGRPLRRGAPRPPGPIGTIGSDFRPIVASDGVNPHCYGG
jgi:hypothetical protein